MTEFNIDIMNNKKIQKFPPIGKVENFELIEMGLRENKILV